MSAAVAVPEGPAASGSRAGRAGYVFIVGTSRSGTTLVRNILNRARDVAIAPENHYLGHLLASEGVRFKLRRFGDLGDDRNVERLVDFLYDGGLARASRLRGTSRFWQWLGRHVSREDLVARLRESDRSERAILAALLSAYAEDHGASVKGEKTPAHVRYVDTLLGWFPDGRVVHMVRDPRAVFVSELRRRRKAPGSPGYRALARIPGALAVFVLVETTLAWADSIRRARRNAVTYRDRYCVVLFERLVRDPEREIRRVCSFLGLPFDAAMLEQTVVSEGQRLGERGIDAGAADRWQTSIRPVAVRWFDAWFGRELRTLGYEPRG